MKNDAQTRTIVMILLLSALLTGAAAAQDGAVGYAPTVHVDIPDLPSDQPKLVGTTFTIGVVGVDPDASSGLPVVWRILYTPAVLADGTPITTRALYEAHVDALVDWGDEFWSPWMRYSADPLENRITFSDQTPGELFLAAVQVIDTCGVVSLGRDYQVEVAHLQIEEVLNPAVLLCEYHLGCWQETLSAYEIAAGQPLNFAWIADASAYAGTIVSYRHGWDLADPEDPNDPGWAVPPGLSEGHLQADEKSFQDGLHTFWLRVVDDSTNITLMRVDFPVIPFVPRDMQRELLVIDQVVDANVNNWLDQQGDPRNDESYRNAFWQFLQSGPGGVDGFDWNQDRFDHRETATYADLVGYKSVLCYARMHVLQTMFNQFRPVDATDLEGDPVKRDPFVWLKPYQDRGGNFFLAGERSMESFLESETNYMTPMVFDTAEPDWLDGDVPYQVSFGEKTLPDGTVVTRGPLLYPYATAGISLLDWTSSSSMYIYGRPQTRAMDQRKVECVGLKGLVLDSAFKSSHGVGPSDFPDTIMTDSEIDWHDDALWARGDLSIVTGSFPWRDDEFVDGNISPRTTDWAPQTCDDPSAPGGLCVEPMFRGLARFDWLREFMWSHGAPEWPTEGDPDYWDYGAEALDDSCGVMALTSYEKEGGFVMPRGSALTNDRIFGYLSYTSVLDKPGGKADVYWGFDPYRFDNEQAKDAVRWVLKYFEVNVLN